jgi:hypothetical protein
VSREFFEKCEISLVLTKNILRTLHSVWNIHIFSVKKAIFQYIQIFQKSKIKTQISSFFLEFFWVENFFQIFCDCSKFPLDFPLKFIIVELF